MPGYGSVGKDQLRQYTCEQVAHWLSDNGFFDTSKFLSRNIDGRKLLDLKEWQLSTFFTGGSANKRSEFWSILQSIRNDSQISGDRQNSSIFPQRDERPAYNRPRQGSLPNQGIGNFLPRPKQGMPGERPPMQEPYARDDSFSDEEEGNYMDDPVTLPSQTSSGNNQHYPRPGGYTDHRPYQPPSGFDRPNHTDRFNPPQTNPRTRQQGPNYTKWNPAGKVPPASDDQEDYLTFVNRQPAALPGNPPISSGRLPIRLPTDAPAFDGQDDYLTLDCQGPNSNHSFGSVPPFRGPSRPQLPPPSLPPPRDPPHPLAMSPPGVPPRSPVRHPQKPPDQFPERPPPQPPRPSQPVPIFPPNPPYHPKSRNNSDKSSPHISPRPSFKDDDDSNQRKTRIGNQSFDSPRISPSSSRKEENNVISHLITRQANRSTDSSSSTSSEELTHRPVAHSTFVPTKSGRNVTNFVSKMPDRPISMTQMPPLVSSAAESDNVIYDLGKALKQRFPKAKDHTEGQDVPSNRKPLQSPKSYSDGNSSKPSPLPKPVPKQNALPQAPPALPPRKPTFSDSGPDLPVRYDGQYESISGDIYDDTVGVDDVEAQHWYKENMERKDAQRFIEKENGRFVVRKRPSSNTEPYALTLWANGKFYNFVIRKRSDGEYALGSEKEGERSFASVVKLIDYHQKNPVVLAEGVGSVKLIL